MNMNDKDLRCEICKIQYDLQFFVPICIPCGHTMCFPCLKDKYKKEGKIKCQNDDKTFSLKPDLYAKNYYIIKLLQNKKLVNSVSNETNNSNNNVTKINNFRKNSNSNNASKLSNISDYDSYENYSNENLRNKSNKNMSSKEKILNPFSSNTTRNISNFNNDVNNNNNLSSNNFDNSNNSNSNSNNNSSSKVNFKFSGNSK